MTIVRVARVERRPFFTPKALAEYLAISERTIRDMLSRQRIPSYKVEGQRRIDPADAEKYLAPNRNGWNLKLRRDAQDAIRRVLSVMVEDAIDERCASVNPFKGMRLRGGDPRVTKPGPPHGHLDTRPDACISRCGWPSQRADDRGAFRLRDPEIPDLPGQRDRLESSREKDHDPEGPIPPSAMALLRAMPIRIDVE